MGFRKGYGDRYKTTNCEWVANLEQPSKNKVPYNHKSNRLLIWIRDKHCVG